MPRHRRSTSCNLIQRIPQELLVCEVLGRIAATSHTELFNLKSSCKLFNEIAEDKYLYRRVSLDKFPMIPWNPSMEKKTTFFNKCRESNNPEAMYRQAVVDYFNRSNLKSACKHLLKAVKLGHVEAIYLTCIILLLCGDNESRKKGVNMLARLRKSKSAQNKFKIWRNNLLRKLREMWVKNPDLVEPPKCCPSPDQHPWKNQWCEDDECSECEACNADREIKRICSAYTG
ncbi:Unknown protein [Striga hermonthica]|uniref:At2g35280-like TPR domain-containing protein n=1 Tax=Striga hermonthica TaxID=68872 RepID=A0A9N7N2L6_STRHE|nr:Unknown protein [Striga hermonthica]